MISGLSHYSTKSQTCCRILDLCLMLQFGETKQSRQKIKKYQHNLKGQFLACYGQVTTYNPHWHPGTLTTGDAHVLQGERTPSRLGPHYPPSQTHGSTLPRGSAPHITPQVRSLPTFVLHGAPHATSFPQEETKACPPGHGKHGTISPPEIPQTCFTHSETSTDSFSIAQHSIKQSTQCTAGRLFTI